MKHLPAIAGILLGLLFIMSSVVVLFHLMPPDKMPKPPTAEAGMFMGALAPTVYLTMVKIFELLGGILVAVPKTRNWGLLILGPILVNILAYHAFLAKGEGLFSPMIIIIVVLALYLLWAGRKGFLGLLNQTSSEK